MTRDTGASGALEALAWRGWVVLPDRLRPGRRGGTLDYVLVGPGGVFVVSRKQWPGPVAVVDGELHLAGRARPRDITIVAEAACDVLALVPDVPVHPVLCLERHEPVTGWVRNVMLCASSNVEEVLTVRPVVLGPEQVRQVADVLSTRLRPVPVVPAGEAATPAARTAAPWPVRMLLQAVTMATAALLVIAVLQTGVVAQISTVVGDLITKSATVDDEPKRRPVPIPAPERMTPRETPSERAGQRSSQQSNQRSTQGLTKAEKRERRQQRERADRRRDGEAGQRDGARDRATNGRSGRSRG